MTIKTTKKKISETFLISMTDVVFLLLIFLMLTSNFVTQAGIQVRLPGSSSGNLQAGDLIHVIYIDYEHIYINNKLMNIDEFRKIIPVYFRSKDQMVRLYTDKVTPLQDVINVMDILRNVGFEKVSIATKQIDR